MAAGWPPKSDAVDSGVKYTRGTQRHLCPHAKLPIRIYELANNSGSPRVCVGATDAKSSGSAPLGMSARRRRRRSRDRVVTSCQIILITAGLTLPGWQLPHAGQLDRLGYAQVREESAQCGDAPLRGELGDRPSSRCPFKSASARLVAQ